MVEIYLTGAVSGWDDPFKWHDELVEEYPDHDFINPYTLNDFELGSDEVYERPHEVVEPAESAIENCDGMLVRWESDIFLTGSAMEVKHAADHDVPVIVWYDNGGDLRDVWLLEKTRGYFDSREKAMKVLLGFVDNQFTFSK